MNRSTRGSAARRIWRYGRWVSVAVISGACATRGLDPRVTSTGPCTVDSGFAGTWTDMRMTQLGPAWVKFTFECDCTYESRVQLLWMRIRERGRYHAQSGRVRFVRPSGEVTWGYRLEGGRLELEEAPGDLRRYARAQGRSCESPRNP